MASTAEYSFRKLLGEVHELRESPKWKLKAAAALNQADEGQCELIFRSVSPEEMVELLNALIERTAAAAGPGLGRAEAAGLRKRVRHQVSAELERQLCAPNAKSFYSVGSTEAARLVRALGLWEIDGLALAAAETQAPEGVHCDAFDWSAYSSGEVSAGVLAAHHRLQLRKVGVQFGLGGFEVYDTHDVESSMLAIQFGGQVYEGMFDVCVAPYGLMTSSAPRQGRIVYQHETHKGAFEFSEGIEGQAVVGLLAAYSDAQCPLLLDINDGITHHILTIRGKEVYEWVGLTPTQAYALQARYLRSEYFHAARTLELKTIPSWLQAPMRLVRKLRPPSGQGEQL